MTIWRGQQPLILASQSAARKTLLYNAGISFEALPADIDEREIQKASGLTSPGEVASLLAERKAAFVSLRHPGRYVIGADQTLARGSHLFSKPAGRIEAAQQLRALAGQTHELHSAIAVVCDGATLFSDVSVAHMTMRALNDSAIETYLDAAGDVVTSSVGAYQLEGLGVHLFELIEGDHFTILGLPLLPLLKFLRSDDMIAI
ncbi:septum formation inhibitor Maf [Tardiphaga sp. vice352]|uniref:Maf family protein n=1 Tax=unclassified Tardiphaga TaxID=2631404 RepID=UPI001163941C|nr:MULTISPECIES: Maf family protein [unclassified Tardiphaga]QDM14855.1 septum formation inhibitor Maf [Tardiphaga sp. vice278]QDM19963.1 septum formation inhibitor Maf [Tardiphaga sp. vice154]QDM25036.1 septum formation inhibitor Maf [Tardiphaga sp. vice304]QDM30246.1 septum formation inhibitor Maf [Tardiphaga sp. vice352]